MKIIIGIGNYVWNSIKSIGAVIWTINTRLYIRLFRLISHIISGPIFFFLGLFKGIKLLFSQPGQWIAWLLKSLISILAWIGRVVSKIMDVALLGELLDLIFQMVKPNSRTLTQVEMEEARKVFGDNMFYWQIRIDEYSLIAKLGARFSGSFNMGVTTFHTINFTGKIVAGPGNPDMRWLIHELAHAGQMEQVGIQYIVEALVAQNTGGYDYGGPNALVGKQLKNFNREQQADIVADYYYNVLYGNTSPDYYLHLIEEFNMDRYALKLPNVNA
jgi:hypothetical protein